MRATVSAAELTAAVAWLGKLLPSRPTEPAWGGIKLIATEEQTLILIATDRDITGSATLPAADVAPGVLLVSGALLRACTRTLGADDSITVTEHEHIAELSVSTGTGWRLPRFDLDLYPAVAGLPDAVAEVDAAELTAGLARVLPFVSQRDGPFGGAVAVSGVDEQLVVAATDGFRLGVVEIPAGVPWPVPEVRVPAAVLQAAVAAIKNAPVERVALRLDASGIGFTGTRYTVRGPALSVDMPWQKVDLGGLQPETSVRVETAALRSTLDRTSVACDPEEPVVLDFTAEEIVIEPMIGSRARARHLCVPLAHSGPIQSVGMKPDFLADALDAAGPYAEFGFVARRWHPILIRGCDEHGTPGPFRASLAQRKMPKQATA